MDMIGKSCIIGAFVTYQWKIKNGLDICNSVLGRKSDLIQVVVKNAGERSLK